MGRSVSFCGVILAAGESTRMGRDKALLPWPPQSSLNNSGETFLSAAIRLFAPYVDMVLVVVGKNQAELAPIVYSQGASMVVNSDPARGQRVARRRQRPPSARSQRGVAGERERGQHPSPS